ncbi:MAG: HD domain-containing phosphohydrolase [Microcystaceae cyanobacterium]
MNFRKILCSSVRAIDYTRRATFSHSFLLNNSVVDIFGASDPAKILIIDKNPHSRLLLGDLLSQANEGYCVLETDDTDSLFEQVLKYQPDLLLVDVLTPQETGFEFCRQLKNDSRTATIPVVLMTVNDDNPARLKSQEVKADGLLSKPLEELSFLPKVALLVQRKRLYEWLEQIQQVLFLIAEAVETRSLDGRTSSRRLDQMAQSFGQFLKLSPVEINDLILASHLHDIGTVVIPDSIFLKQGELTLKERELVKQHVLIGEKICRPMQNRRGIAQIIRHHHEKWDGSGYPDGLKTSDIPYLAQIFQILDIYDALTSHRPHKKALPPQEALRIIKEETAKGWRNPQLSTKFIEYIEQEAE